MLSSIVCGTPEAVYVLSYTMMRETETLHPLNYRLGEKMSNRLTKKSVATSKKNTIKKTEERGNGERASLKKKF